MYREEIILLLQSFPPIQSFWYFKGIQLPLHINHCLIYGTDLLISCGQECAVTAWLFGQEAENSARRFASCGDHGEPIRVYNYLNAANDLSCALFPAGRRGVAALQLLSQHSRLNTTLPLLTLQH